MELNFATIFSLLAAITFAISSIWYLVDVAKRRVTVSIATFLMLTIVNSSQLISLIVKEVWAVVPFTIVGTVAAFLTLLFALRNRKIYFELLDKLGLFGALAAFIVWLVTNDAAYNIYIINVVTAIAFVPLIVKAFKSPHLESTTPWQVNLAASFFLLLSINSMALYAIVPPLRQFICSLLVNIGLYRGNLKAKSNKRGKELEMLP